MTNVQNKFFFDLTTLFELDKSYYHEQENREKCFFIII
jgi:hypothetical protein